MVLTISEEKIKNIILNDVGKKVSVLGFSPVYGGCVNSCFKVDTSLGCFFLKWGKGQSSEMFKSESRGLNLIKKNSLSISVPRVVSYNKDYLLMEFVKGGERNNLFWEKLGRGVSEMHKTTNSLYGLNYNNFIGSLSQKNNFEKNWSEFFINQRLIPQLSFGGFSKSFLLSFDKLFVKLDSLFPKEPPSLLHGDLWYGNFLVGTSLPVLVDPSVYFGCREMDIAMSSLFGGFDVRFYDSYNELSPLADGWENRLDLCNLYPLLVHVNLFGGGYYNQIKNILSRFV